LHRKDIVIEGNALGDNPSFPAVQGVLTAFNRTNGEKIWNLRRKNLDDIVIYTY
jgi:outer membrane protein assembly factor BamB